MDYPPETDQTEQTSEAFDAGDLSSRIDQADDVQPIEPQADQTPPVQPQADQPTTPSTEDPNYKPAFGEKAMAEKIEAPKPEKEFYPHTGGPEQGY